MVNKCYLVWIYKNESRMNKNWKKKKKESN